MYVFGSVLTMSFQKIRYILLNVLLYRPTDFELLYHTATAKNCTRMLKWNEVRVQSLVQLVQRCWIVSETNPVVSATLDEFRQAGALSTVPCQCLALFWTFFFPALLLSLLLGLLFACFVSFFIRLFYSLPAFANAWALSSSFAITFYLCTHPLPSMMWLKSLSSFPVSEQRATRSEVEWGQSEVGLCQGGWAKEGMVTEQHVISLKCSLQFSFITSM